MNAFTTINDPYADFPPADLARIDALRAPAAFKLACRMALNLRRGRLAVSTPAGDRLLFQGVEDGPEGHARLIRWRAARRMMLGGNNGAAQSFIDGDWDSPDLTGVLSVFASNVDDVERFFNGTFLRRQLSRLLHLLNRNTKKGARRNILSHYDLGNAFYARWLDPTMTYSSARFVDPPREELKDAQIAKYAALADQIGLSEGDHVLEIGCGWGGFAEYAAGVRGASVTGVTLSDAQLEYARERIARAGLSDRVDLRLQDYRDVEGQFDKIASIEMFEAVGREYWPQFFGKVRACLRSGGQAGLQIITICDDRFDAYCRQADFIQRYVFPGGMLPSPSALADEFDRAGLAVRSAVTFGSDYAETLQRWRIRFLDAWDEIRHLGFDDRFRRLWRFYLSYCEAGFRTSATNVAQYALVRD